LFAAAIIGWHFVLQTLPGAGVLMFAPLLVAVLSGRVRRGSMMWKLFATPEDESTPEIIRAAERMSLRFPQANENWRKPCGVRGTRLARLSVVVRRAVRRIRKSQQLATVRVRAKRSG
jgi:membrane glycosyltransferase